MWYVRIILLGDWVTYARVEDIAFVHVWWWCKRWWWCWRWCCWWAWPGRCEVSMRAPVGLWPPFDLTVKTSSPSSSSPSAFWSSSSPSPFSASPSSWFQKLFWNQCCDVVQNLPGIFAFSNFYLFHSTLTTNHFFQITPVLNTGLSLSEPLQLYIKGNHLTHLLATRILYGFNRISLQYSAK